MKAQSNPAEPVTAASKWLQVPIQDVLNRAGHELAHLGWLLDNLQFQLRPLLQDAAGRNAGMLRQIQSFDHIGQIARGLEAYLEALASQTPRDWLIDPFAAAQNVGLADLSSRLGSTGEEKDLRASGPDECELF